MSGRVFRLEIRLEGAAFEAFPEADRLEVCRLLRETAEQVERERFGPHILRDINGNSCGGVWLSVEEAEDGAFLRGAPAGRRIVPA